MQDPNELASRVTAVFGAIHREQMLGLPLLNNMLEVETLGFQAHGERVIGVLITPWLMNLVMFPAADDDWGSMELGDKQPHEFPSGTYKFMVNEIDGIGRCQTHSLFSPMREFTSQAHALAAAEAFLRDLQAPLASDHAEPVDEELLGRVMRGEDTPEIDMDALEQGRLVEVENKPTRRLADIEVRVEDKMVSRRELLRGLVRDS